VIKLLLSDFLCCKAIHQLYARVEMIQKYLYHKTKEFTKKVYFMKKDYHFYIVTAAAVIAVLFLLSYTNMGIPSVGQALNVGTTTGGDLAITCTDSDKGADYTVVGQTKGLQKSTMITGSSTFVSVVDYCYDTSTLIEYTCENNYVATSEIHCDCQKGICARVAR